MRRWALLSLVPFVLATAALTGCDRLGGGGGRGDSIAETVLRVGEDVGTEVETWEGELPAGLTAALNADSVQEEVRLPQPPNSTLLGSGRVARADGALTFFVMYEVPATEGAASDAMRELVDTPPWQVVGGQSNEAASVFSFQNTRDPGIAGSVVVQPLPASERFDIVVSRDGGEKTLTVQRRAFIPVLGAEFEERDGGLVVSRIVPGEAADAGLQEGDRVVRVGGQEVRDQASFQAALRSLAGGAEQRTSVVYIVQVRPDLPLRPIFSAPPARPLPKDFPAPFLVLEQTAPVAARWSTGAAGGTYEVTMLTTRTPADVVRAYQQVLPQQQLNITSDTAEGSATVLQFARDDGSLNGQLTVDTFEQDESFTVVSLELQSLRGAAGPARPGAVPVAPSPTPSPSPGAGATPTATGTPRP